MVSALKKIRQYCKEQCCNRDLKSWKECSMTNCPLHAFRMGKRPKKQPTFSLKEIETKTK